jgi:hypothetical protein
VTCAVDPATTSIGRPGGSRDGDGVHSCGTPFAADRVVLIRRCAWHRTYYRYPLAIGVASWRGLGLSFTDGMCGGCAVHFRRQWGLPDLPAPGAAVESFAPGMAFLRVAATFLLIAGFMFEARLLDEVHTPLRLTSAPETVLVPPAPAEPESVPAAAVPAPARRPRPVAGKPSTVPEAPVTVVAAPVISVEPAEADASVASPPTVELVSLPEPVVDPDRAPPWTRRSTAPPAGSFAALPHAGLAQQAP